MRRSLLLLVSCCLFLVATPALAATLFFSPSAGTYLVGRNFTVNVMTTSSEQAMNAAEGVVHFPTDLLDIASVSKTGSIFSLWVQEPSFSNSGSVGNARFEGVVLNPGFVGANAKILSVTFRVKAAGTATVTFASGSVLANDGSGTNILTSLGSATFNLQPSAGEPPVVGGLPEKPTIKHFVKGTDGELKLFNASEDGLKWTNSSFAKLVWAAPADVTGVSTVFDESGSTAPSSKAEGFFDSKTFNFLEEGRHYFHLRFINARGAGSALHYPLFVDLTPPKAFGVTGASDPRPRLTFSTTDSLSGIDRYEIKIGDAAWVNAEPFLGEASTYTLPKQKPGATTVIVRAYDKAGNYTDSQIRLTIEAVAGPVITEYPKHLTSPGQVLVVAGIASPEAAVEVILRRRTEEPLVLSAKADAQGNWRLSYDGIIMSGRYALTAKQILGTGAESLETDPVYIYVNSLLWRLWHWLINIGGFLLLLLILILILALLAYYYWHRFKMLRRRLRKEAKEAEDVLHRDIGRIKSELQKGVPRERISRDIEQAAKEVEKEIKDIEKL